MTAPAEDPRGGEHVGSCRIFYAERRCTCVGPAAGRGDTDSSGEAWRPVCGCEQGMGHMDRGCHSYGLCHAQSAERAARAAGDRAQPTEELREAIKDTLFLYGIRGERLGSLRPGSVADALLAGPLAALLDAQAAVERVEALADELLSDAESAITPGYYRDAADRIRAALDGTT